MTYDFLGNSIWKTIEAELEAAIAERDAALASREAERLVAKSALSELEEMRAARRRQEEQKEDDLPSLS